MEETLESWEQDVLARRLERLARPQPGPVVRRIINRLLRRDPVIVFDQPDWIRPDDVRGTMPLALVAHWD